MVFIQVADRNLALSVLGFQFFVFELQVLVLAARIQRGRIDCDATNSTATNVRSGGGKDLSAGLTWVAAHPDQIVPSGEEREWQRRGVDADVRDGRVGGVNHAREAEEGQTHDHLLAADNTDLGAVELRYSEIF
eukprot:SAG31_NODE_1300_length_8906_cov_139.354604_9_plen_134_part_00